MDDVKKVTKAYVLSDGEVISQDTLNKYSVKAQSKQLPPDVFQELYGPLNIVEPMYDFRVLAQLLEENTYHNRACKTKAQDSTGLGWTLVPKANVKVARPSQKKFLEEFLQNNGTDINSPVEDLEEVLNRMMVDYEAIGNGYIEVIRDAVDQPLIGLDHIPAHTMRRHSDGIRFLQMWGARRRWFKMIGVEDDVDMNTGVMYPKGTLAPELRANEVMFFANYTARSTYYGVPDVLPALRAILADKEAVEYNIEFFENYAVPAYAVTLTGADLDYESQAAIKKYFQEDIKTGRHSTLVLTAQRDPSDPNSQPAEFKFEKLGIDTKDASFRLLREDNRNEILVAHGIPPYRIGITEVGSLGGNIAEESTEIYKQSVLAPRQKMLERVINRVVVWGAFKATDWEFKFNVIDNRDKQGAVDNAIKLFDIGVYSPNEVRQQLGLEPIANDALDKYYIKGKVAEVTGTLTDTTNIDTNAVDEPGVEDPLADV